MRTIKTKAACVGMMLWTAFMLCAVSCTKLDTIEELGDEFEVGVSGTYDGYGYVDLGLPSGTLWATCNVGAASPEAYGDYFAWGETSTKTTYDWNNYNYCYGGDYDQLTKYCNRSDLGYNGFTDTLAVLQTEDDAAIVNWGEGWCIPTEEQWKEFVDKTTSTWVKWKGVEGRLFTGPNGKTVFLPAGGSRNQYDAGEFGNYWSSSLDLIRPRDARFLYFHSSYPNLLSNNERNDGCLVRPVRSASMK